MELFTFFKSVHTIEGKCVDMCDMNSFMNMTITTKEQSKLFGVPLYLLNQISMY